MPNKTSEHIVSSYEDELIHLAASIAEMGGAVETAISSSVDAGASERSAAGSTWVFSDVSLFPGTRSAVVDLTSALLIKIPLAVGVSTRVTVTVSPKLIIPILHTTS